MGIGIQSAWVPLALIGFLRLKWIAALESDTC